MIRLLARRRADGEAAIRLWKFIKVAYMDVVLLLIESDLGSWFSHLLAE